MTGPESVKARTLPGSLVAVIASATDLLHANRLRVRPDLFELRLDAIQPMPSQMATLTRRLARPVIITARHPNEGGRQGLSLVERRKLLHRFLPWASLVDVELRSSSGLRSVLEAARERKVKCVISVHDFRRTLSRQRLNALLQRARKLRPDIFKMVTRTDTPAQLARLLRFFEENKNVMPLSVMGVGKLGKLSRMKLIKAGSVLNYAHLSESSLEGQFSLAAACRCRKRSLT